MSLENEKATLSIAKKNLWLTFFGLLLAGASAYFVWESLNAANQNFFKDKRPWMGFDLPNDDAAISRIFEPSKDRTGRTYHVPWKNFGNSPALRARQHTKIYKPTLLVGQAFDKRSIDWTFVKTEIESLRTEAADETVVFPAQIVPSDGPINETLGGPLPLAGASAQRDVFILIGVATYEDSILNAGHESQICLILFAPPGGNPTGWEVCPVTLVVN